MFSCDELGQHLSYIYRSVGCIRILSSVKIKIFTFSKTVTSMEKGVWHSSEISVFG